MSPEDQEKYIREYVKDTRQHFATYHNHKEQMAYITTALYLTGSSAFFFQKVPEGVCKTSYQWSIGCVVTILTVIAFLFVSRQLSLRSVASNIISACDICRLQWLKAFYNPEIPLCHKKYKPHRYIEIDMPKFLYDTMQKIKPSKSARRLKLFTQFCIVFTFIVLLIRIARY
jgi:hypothetical protein